VLDLRQEGAYLDRLPIEKLAAHERFQCWSPTLEGDPTPPRRRVLTPIQENQVASQVKEWLELRVIEPIPTPPLINNLVLAAKKNGKIRVCIDCTPVNKVTRELEWPLPRIQDVRHLVKTKTWFSRIDLRNAFFRISVPHNYRHLTAFTCQGKSYQFRKMPFGLKTAPATFQRFMDHGLSDLSEGRIWYQDDILIGADTLEELRVETRRTKERLRQMKCEINEEKSEYEVRETTYVGLRLYGYGVGPDPVKLAELLQLASPKNKVEAQSALGLVSYLRDFIPLMSHFTAQLYPDKNGLRLAPLEYEKEWGRLIRHVREAASTTRHWKEGVDADLYTDASGHGLGAVLIQQERLVAVASRKLSPAETRYSATDREHLGLLFAAQRFRLFLHQSSSTTRVWTDHSALVTRKPDEMTPRQARWHTLVSAWMPNMSHVKGKDNPADYVSRWGADSIGGNF
jgi:hypothetical protein